MNAHKYKEIYEMLGINLSKLGCLMLDTEPIKIEYYQIMQDGVTAYFPEYKAKNKDRFWIDGYVADKVPHVTLFYGFLNEAGSYKKHIDILLQDWKMEEIEIESIGYFDSPYEDEDYYCVVAHVKKTDELIEGNNRMQFLPHITTFIGYKPHITIAYIIKDEAIRDDFIKHLEKELVGEKLKVTGLNYGGNK